MSVLPSCVSVYLTCVYWPEEGVISLETEAAMCVLGTEVRSSARAASAPNCGALSPVPGSNSSIQPSPS